MMSSDNFQSIIAMERLHQMTRELSSQEENKDRDFKRETIKKNLSDIFQCLICYSKISKDAMLCPHRSKLC